MVKEKDRIKGFRFEGRRNSCALPYHLEMEDCVGLEGEVLRVGPMDDWEWAYHGCESALGDIPKEDRPPVIYVRFLHGIPSRQGTFHYPLAEYLQTQREERLKELGI